MKIFTQSKLELKKLSADLSQFGLCPKDWNLEAVEGDQLLIRHKEAADFFFVGQTKKQKKSQVSEWQFITLASI